MTKQIVQAVDRALRILQTLATSDTLLPLSTIAESVQIPASTTHRLLASLRHQNFVRYDADERTYGLGVGALALARAARMHTTIYDEAAPLLQELAEISKETATLVLLNQDVGNYAMMARSKRSMTLTATPGAPVPLHATASGKAMLAYLPEAEIERLLAEKLEAFTPHTITNSLRLKEELSLIRAQGYAVDNEEREIGMRCLAAPVFDHTENVAAAVGISGPSSRISPDQEEELTQPVLAAAHRLSVQLGYLLESTS